MIIWLTDALTAPGDAWTEVTDAASRIFADGLPGAAELVARYVRFVWSVWQDITSTSGPAWSVCLAVVLLAAAPVLLIAPIVGPPALAPMGRSLRATVVGAGVIAGGLSAGVLASLYDLAYLISTASQASGQAGGYAPAPLSSPMTVAVVWGGAWLLLGTLWAIAIRAVGQRRDPEGVLRVFRWLLAGTALELALAVSALAWARRRDSCLCGWSSFWGIVYGLCVLILLCGPAIILLYTRQARAQWARLACRHCGYPRRTDSSVCSECGGTLQ